jgi:glycerate-2-kinase
VIGRFPWDPFPAGTPDPKGPDPLQALVYRSAVTGADAYRSVRLALRVEGDVLRIGNRFVARGRYREVAFIAAGNAANSMALATLAVLDERVTQGFLAGPEPVPSEIPFKGVLLPPGWGGAPEADVVRTAVREIAGGLRESDLLILLLSPGAVRALGSPPPGLTAPEFSAFLEGAHANGATGREVEQVARVLGRSEGDEGILPRTLTADVETLVVDRGDGAALVGGGPTVPVRSDQRAEARAALDRVGQLDALSEAARDRLRPGADDAPGLAATVRRPVVVAGPPDALRAAADVTFDKGWTARLAALEIRDRAELAADRFLEAVEGIVRTERADVGPRSKGVAALATITLDLPEGTDEGPELIRFLERARTGLRRREMSVGLVRTAGAIGAPEFPPGGVVGAVGDASFGVSATLLRPLDMRRGITDVGLVAAAVLPEAAPSAEADR